jgi:hypothetical protein
MWMSVLFLTAPWALPEAGRRSTSLRQEEAPHHSAGDPRTPLATSSCDGLTAVRVQPGLQLGRFILQNDPV